MAGIVVDFAELSIKETHVVVLEDKEVILSRLWNLEKGKDHKQELKDYVEKLITEYQDVTFKQTSTPVQEKKKEACTRAQKKKEGDDLDIPEPKKDELIEKYSKGSLAHFYIGKTYVDKDKGTWNKNGINSRWNDHKTGMTTADVCYDVMVVLTVVTKKCLPREFAGPKKACQDYCLELEKSLIEHYNYDQRFDNKTKQKGKSAANLEERNFVLYLCMEFHVEIDFKYMINLKEESLPSKSVQGCVLEKARSALIRQVDRIVRANEKIKRGAKRGGERSDGSLKQFSIGKCAVSVEDPTKWRDFKTAKTTKDGYEVTHVLAVVTADCVPLNDQAKGHEYYATTLQNSLNTHYCSQSDARYIPNKEEKTEDVSATSTATYALYLCLAFDPPIETSAGVKTRPAIQTNAPVKASTAVEKQDTPKTNPPCGSEETPSQDTHKTRRGKPKKLFQAQAPRK